MASTPLTKPIQNVARIAALLINEGTTALRKHLEKSIMNTKNNPLCYLLHQKEQQIQSHFKGDKSKNIPSVLTKHQMDLLYPTKGTAKSESFDITLLALLIRIVCDEPIPPSTHSWTKHPDDRDFSFAADVVRLRSLRNELHCHISGTGMDDSDFERCWKTLEDILIRLDVSKEHIDKWRFRHMDRDLATQLKEELTRQIENDLETLHEMAKAVFPIQQDKKRLEENLTQKLDKFKSYIEEKQKLHTFLATEISQLCSSHIELSTSDQSSRLDAVLTRQDNHSEESGTIIKELYLGRRKNKNEVLGNLKDIKKKYKDSKGTSIFILIMNGPSGKDDCRELGNALGYVPWHIIIDLDHQSKCSTELFDCVRQTLEKQKEILTVSYKETKELSDGDKRYVASGNKSLWIQANGCCEKKHHESLNKFSIAKHNIDCLIGEIFETTGDNQNVLCTTLLMDRCEHDTTNAFVKLLEVVHEACERNERSIDDQYIGLATSENQRVLDDLQKKQTMLVGLTTFSQITSLMLQVFSQKSTFEASEKKSMLCTANTEQPLVVKCEVAHAFDECTLDGTDLLPAKTLTFTEHLAVNSW